eukprot:4325836-Prymnesium_polylepis.1
MSVFTTNGARLVRWGAAPFCALLVPHKPDALHMHNSCEPCREVNVVYRFLCDFDLKGACQAWNTQRQHQPLQTTDGLGAGLGVVSKSGAPVAKTVVTTAGHHHDQLYG